MTFTITFFTITFVTFTSITLFFCHSRVSFLIVLLLFLRAACSLFPDTLARCSRTVSICIFLAYGLLILLTFAMVALASATVANLMLTVSLGFSSVYNRLSLPFGFLPVPTLGSAFFFFLCHYPSISTTCFFVG